MLVRCHHVVTKQRGLEADKKAAATHLPYLPSTGEGSVLLAVVVLVVGAPALCIIEHANLNNDAALLLFLLAAAVHVMRYRS